LAAFFCLRLPRNVLIDLLNKIAKARVLVIGDAMLDRYWYGGVERISPEAPVPVVAVAKSEERPGGAANVACNVTAIGAQCTLIAPSGDDSAADSLERLARAAGIDCILARDKLVNTTVKLRVVSRNQQLIRIDFETQVSKDTRTRLLDTYLEVLPKFDVVIVSDYGKGGMAHVQEMIQVARARGLPVVIDPKGDDYTAYRGATLITPNRKEFEQVAGRFHDDAELERKAAAMLDNVDLDGVLVTRSEEGMSLIDRTGRTLHVPAQAREVYDVTGAGDTVIAMIGAAYAVNGDIEEAMQLANIAAGIGVGRQGAVAVTRADIEHELMHYFEDRAEEA
jgi:rfaE bifunctional protein kinase chain/domain